MAVVEGLPDDEDSAAITEAIIAMARKLKFTVIAEGVETEAQASFLIRKGCHEAQGYLYSQPLPPQEIGLIFKKPYL